MNQREQHLLASNLRLARLLYEAEAELVQAAKAHLELAELRRAHARLEKRRVNQVQLLSGRVELWKHRYHTVRQRGR